MYTTSRDEKFTLCTDITSNSVRPFVDETTEAAVVKRAAVLGKPTKYLDRNSRQLRNDLMMAQTEPTRTDIPALLLGEWRIKMPSTLAIEAIRALQKFLDFVWDKALQVILSFAPN
jgi:hypothetical protein